MRPILFYTLMDPTPLISMCHVHMLAVNKLNTIMKHNDLLETRIDDSASDAGDSQSLYECRV